MKLDGMNLRQLLARTGEGDHDAFAEVYRRTHAHLFGLALRMLRREAAAEDVLQDAFVSIWKNAAGYRPQVGGREIQPMTWLIAIVRNKALDVLRSSARRQESPWPDAADGQEDAQHPHAGHAGSALELLAQATESMRVAGCLQLLDGSHRQSLALAYYQGLTHTEVAAQMGAPLGSVKAWIRRGLEKLKDCLRGQGVTAP